MVKGPARTAWALAFVLAAAAWVQSEEAPPFASTILLPRGSADEIPLKVAIVERTREASLAVGAPFRLRRALSGEVLFSSRTLPHQALSLHAGGFQLGRQAFFENDLILEADDPLKINGQAFRGRIRVLKDRTQESFTLINEVPLEIYLQGVLPKEVDPRWPLEALKAQAVASRTYALFNQLSRAAQPYALTSEEASQLYGGDTPRDPRTAKAIHETKGEVLTVGGQLFVAYFHASCGGHTSGAHTVWNLLPVDSLRGVPCTFCWGAKHEQWEARFSRQEIALALGRAGIKIGMLESLAPVDFDLAGRAQKIWLAHSGGEVTVPANTFRLALGSKRLRSARFYVQLEGLGALVFRGRGWGHGVGLCQWGARAQAEEGKSYRQILSYYYPGSRIEKLG